MGHLHEDAFLLLGQNSEFISFFSFIFKFANPGEVWITKAIIFIRKQYPEGFWVVGKWRHRVNGLLLVFI